MTTARALSDADLAACVAEMKQIHRGEKGAEGGATPADRATAYRRARLLPEAIRRARARHPDPAPCSLLVSLSGFSPETTIIAWEILRPPAVLILSSDSAAASVDIIFDHLCGAGLRPSQIRHEAIDPSDVRALYEAIERSMRRQSAEQAAGVILDITGGKKLMSAAGALAASQLQLRLAYVDSDYDPELRAPMPCTERLVLLPSPSVIFASEREREAEALFDSGAYGEARIRFRQLSDTMERPAYARLCHALSALYAAWMDLDFAAIASSAAEVLAPLAAAGLSAERTRLVEAQATWLALLARERAPRDLNLCLYLLGRHYRAAHRHDFSALFFYRAIEGVLVDRVRARAPGFDPSAPDYRLLSEDVAELTHRYDQALGGSRGAATRTLPPQVGFVSSAALLVALGDEATDLGRLRNLSQVRNSSVLAHGTTPVSESDAGRLERAAQQMLRSDWPDLEARIGTFSPLRLRS